MQTTGKLTKKHKEEYIYLCDLTTDAKPLQRKRKQNYWRILTESVLAGIAWNG